jgi:hypothetical protein
MLKYMIAGALSVLAIVKLCELVDTTPNIGIPITIVLTFAWMIEIFREFNKGRR